MTAHADEALAQLADRVAVEWVINEYFACIDRGYDLDALRDLFDEKADLRSSLAPDIRTLKDFLEFQQGAREIVSWAFHLVTTRVLDVDGDGARATAKALGLHRMRIAGYEDEQAVTYTADYEFGLVRAPDSWRVTSMVTEFHQVSRHQDGWAERMFIEL